ncbi:response regulator transcription factor [Halobellus ordinarius]|jgi:two-component system response regulator MprA|uniref:response regulator transcription factor n=1 Tax=Halobellus ordinarius TaxID=3075120 RepID=UPI00288087ED|nr:response regulator [Halobellus sp. ZY16]
MSQEILTADDDEPIRLLVRHRLESAGYSVRTCEDGREAADLLEGGFEPDMAIFDVMMPRLDGTRLLRMVRNDEFPVDPELPIIMLTSRGREEHVLEGLESGADDYITKPFRAAELLARVRKCIDD